MMCDGCKHAEQCPAKAEHGGAIRCSAYKPQEQTNEEWFCQLSTEEKAEFLVKIELSAMHPVKRGSVDMEKFIEEVVEWLKQPHTFK